MRARRVVAGAAVAAAWSLPALAPLSPAVAAGVRIRRTAASEAGVALTFDDGPHLQGTPQVLELLRDAGVTASFFVVGEQVARAPALVGEVAAAGHEVALHGQRHRNQLRLAPGEVARDLDRSAACLAEVTGAPPRVYRPPYGIFSPVGLALVRRRGLAPLLWSKWGRDWAARATPAGIAAKVTEGLGPGDVLLLHDADHYSASGSWQRTVAALPRVLEEIGRLGLRPLTASEAVWGAQDLSRLEPVAVQPSAGSTASDGGPAGSSREASQSM
ncbi:MAG: polysaccharide deacetylase family protein [Actinomycetota bacterium]|nr:polysaccharide deacetylase family protein [Actinomycetota bacterium]